MTLLLSSLAASTSGFGDVAEKRFRLGIAQDRGAFIGCRGGPRAREAQHQRQHQHPHEAGKRRAHRLPFPSPV